MAESPNGKPVPVTLPDGYTELLEDLKARIRGAQVRATLGVNRELIALYWQVGKAVADRQQEEGWGGSVIEHLARDLQRVFPGLKGFSARNLWRMRAFYLAWTQDVRKLPQPVAEADGQNLPQPVAEIPWGHNAVLVEKLKSPVERLWYTHQTVEHGWSRAVLTVQIETNLYHRQGKAVTNFERTLPPPQSDLAEQALKDPYVFDFLTLADDARERELERGLMDHVQRFLLELGVGFAFVGRQVHLEVGGQDFYLDLLFYHLRLRCFVVIDLKARSFQPEFAGKMNFYLSAVDDNLRHPDDQPTIGLLLCKAKERLIVEYALRDLNKPIGVAEWETKLTRSLPEDLRPNLPTIEELEDELGHGR